jgi:hypothetical protein
MNTKVVYEENLASWTCILTTNGSFVTKSICQKVKSKVEGLPVILRRSRKAAGIIVPGFRGRKDEPDRVYARALLPA